MPDSTKPQAESDVWLRAATHPLPIGLLASGIAVGAIVAWPLAATGAAAYLASVAFLGARKRAAPNTPLLPRPTAPRHVIRSTQVLAHVTRIRRAHEALHRAISQAGTIPAELLADGYLRVCDLVTQTYDFAERADRLRAHIDAEVARAKSGTDTSVLERRCGDAITELARVATSLEALPSRLLLGSGANEEAAQAAREVSEEIEHMRELALALDEVAAPGP